VPEMPRLETRLLSAIRPLALKSASDLTAPGDHAVLDALLVKPGKHCFPRAAQI